jgi:2-polyprenyl-3-methyl-5-hydroxy-6-metoxy-1,4-benzoquinol methylase
MDKTLDVANQVTVEVRDTLGVTRFGLMNNQVWIQDPRRVVFSMARYKFVAKMLSGMKDVLEVGCGDSFLIPIVLQEVGHVTAVDIEPIFVKDAQERGLPPRSEVRLHSILDAPLKSRFDAAYSLDVLEHIPAEKEDTFVGNVCLSLKDDGVFIAGMPSLESQAYASPPSKLGHINCKSGEDFRATMKRHFRNVFMFSMNDEVVHTGYFKMAHYLFAVCCGPKRP